MRFKAFCLFIALISFSSCALSYSYDRRPMIQTSNQGSSIVRSTINSDEDIQDYSLVINDLQKQIKNNPYDYSLLVNLIDAYLRTNKYNEAFSDLDFLNSLRNSGKLSSAIIANIDKLRIKTTERSRYSRQKSPLYINLAAMNLITGNGQEAEKYIRRAAIDTTHHKLFTDGFKLVFDNTGSTDNALAYSSIYLSNNNVPSQQKLEITKLRVKYLTQQGRYEDALKEQTSLLQSDRTEDAIYSTYMLLSKSNASEDKILKTIFNENSKNKEQCYYDLYKILTDNNNLSEAREYALKLEKSYPNSLNTAFLKAERLLKEGQVNQVAEILDSVSDKLTRNEDIAVYNRLMASISASPDQEAMKLFSQGYPDKALELLEGQNITETPNILAFKARCCMEIGKMQKALEYLNKAVAIDPNNLFTNIQFGNYYYVNGDFETAHKYVNKALQIDSTNEFAKMLKDKLNEHDASQYITEIISTFEAQNYKETMRLISQALKIAPNSATLYFYQGLTYIAQNNYAASTASLYKSLELDKSNVLTYYYLGIAFDNLSEYENAYNYYKQFLRLLPTDAFGESEKVDYAKNRINKLQTLI